MSARGAFASLVALLTDREQRVIWRAARAQHAYLQMLRVVDNKPRQLAMMRRKVELDAEFRGDPKPAPLDDLSVPLEEAVAKQLVAMTPAVRTTLVMRRQTRSLASECGPVQIRLSANASASRKLLINKRESRLCMRELAQALGVAERTLERHAAGEKINGERRDWYAQLESIHTEGDFYHVLVRRVAPARKPWGWFLSADEKHRLITGRRRDGSDIPDPLSTRGAASRVCKQTGPLALPNH